MRMEQHHSPFSGSSGWKADAARIALRTEIPLHERALLAGADARIQRTMWAAAALGTGALMFWKGFEWGMGFALGAALALLNFRWLKSAVDVIASAMSAPLPGRGAAGYGASAKPRRAGRTVARFILRYALIGATGYAIFLVSAISLKAFLLGLLVSVAGLMTEALYQLFEAAFQSHRDKQ